MRPLKVSAISFLNTAPLMWDFNHGVTPEQYSDNTLPPELRSDFTVEYTVPSNCAEELKRGGADDPSNMQWQTTPEAKAKDRVE
jgi:chorismate dehydratase